MELNPNLLFYFPLLYKSKLREGSGDGNGKSACKLQPVPSLPFGRLSHWAFAIRFSVLFVRLLLFQVHIHVSGVTVKWLSWLLWWGAC